MRTPALLALAFPAMLALSACESSVSPVNGLSEADLQDLAMELDVAARGALTTGGPSFAEASAEVSGAQPINSSFTASVGCPVGGTLSIAATSTGEYDQAARKLTLATTATVTHEDCAVRNRRDVTITVDGNPNLVMTSALTIVNGVPSGLQTSTQQGSFTYTTSEGATGSCEIDVTSSWDPATRTHTVTGTNCGRTINYTRTRS